MACERDLEGSVRPRAANACSTVRGIDSLDYAEVVADRPVLGQVIALDGEDVQLRPGDLRAARRPVSEPGHTAADMDAVQGHPDRDPAVIEGAPAMQLRSPPLEARFDPAPDHVPGLRSALPADVIV